MKWGAAAPDPLPGSISLLSAPHPLFFLYFFLPPPLFSSFFLFLFFSLPGPALEVFYPVAKMPRLRVTLRTPPEHAVGICFSPKVATLRGGALFQRTVYHHLQRLVYSEAQVCCSCNTEYILVYNYLGKMFMTMGSFGFPPPL